MELTFQWFWLVKLALLAIVLGAAYMALYKHKLKSTVWNILLAVLLVFSYMMPIKMQPTTNVTNIKMDRAIADSKGELPAMKIDDSFKKSNDLPGITKEEITL